MLKNYIKLALRNLAKYKTYSFLNISGLAISLACSILIYLYTLDEVSYDRYNSKADRIYRVTRDFISADGKESLHLGHVAPPFGPLLKNDFPDIEEVVRTLQTSSSIVRYKEKTFNETQGFIAESNIFKVFDIPLISGNAKTALKEPYSVIISNEIAKKYFGKESPLNKVMRVDTRFNLKVTGVYHSFPRNAHMHPAFIISFSTLEDNNVYGKENLKSNWGDNSFATYLLFSSNYPVQRISSQFPSFLDKHMGPKTSSWTHLYLQKLMDIHLRSHLDSEVEANGDIKNLYILDAIALFILIIACINFMNLSTALSANRAKEVGIRKVMGVFKSNLITQFLTESVVYTFIALLLAIFVVALALPFMNEFTNKALSLSYFLNILPLLGVLAFTILVGLLAGSYPALFLSSFRPTQVLKGKIRSGASNTFLRKALVIIQFSISIVLIISTGVIFTQLNYIKNKNLGLSKNHVINLNYYSDKLSDHFESFKNELVRGGLVREVTRSSGIPSGRLLEYDGAFTYIGDSLQLTKTTIKNLEVDEGFIPAYEMKILAGRNFSKEFKSDTSAYILNKAAIESIGWSNALDAVGQTFKYGNRTGKVIGVIDNVHFESLHESISPMVLFVGSKYHFLSIKLKGPQLRESIKHVETTWNRFIPDRPFDYTFLDESFGRLYEKEERQGKIFTLFSCLAIVIGCLGLFGLVSFTAQQRTKEIGIRKVLGASTFSIVNMLSKEFLMLVIISTLIAWPSSFFLMKEWLANFPYKISMPYWMYLISSVLAVAIAFITLSVQSIKAANCNPVESLRSE